MLSGEGSLFKASAQAHPSMLGLKDAEEVRIPMCVLPSMGEEAEVCLLNPLSILIPFSMKRILGLVIFAFSQWKNGSKFFTKQARKATVRLLGIRFMDG
jgi:hypothetical protein